MGRPDDIPSLADEEVMHLVAQGQGERGDERKARTFPEQAKAVTQVLPECIHHVTSDNEPLRGSHDL